MLYLTLNFYKTKRYQIRLKLLNTFLFKTLMAQPISALSTTSIYTTCKSEECEKDLENKKEEMKDTIKMLQIQISKLESTLSTINERHTNEMTCQTEYYVYVLNTFLLYHKLTVKYNNKILFLEDKFHF